MSAQLVRLEKDGHIAILTICNPPLNVITAEVRPQWLAAVSDLKSDANIRCVIVTGDGDRSFCAGADLKEEEGLTPETVRRFVDEDRLVYDAMEELPAPVIAAVNGYCMGGGFELALACDLRIAAHEARFRAAGVRVGLVVSTARLTRLLGVARAKEIILTGRDIDGPEAERLGLVTRSVPRAEVMAEARRWADTIAERAPLAVRAAKQHIHEAAETPFAVAMNRELDLFATLSATRDHKHAIAAFFRKEKPVFRGE